MKQYALLSILVGICICRTNAQQSFNSGGGDAQAVSGSVSFSIGETVYTSYQNNQLHVSEGVQQAYRITATTGIGIDYIRLEVSAYPNPATDFLMLQFDKLPENGSFQLTDIQGKVLRFSKVSGETMRIDMQSYASGIYFLSASQGNTILKTFKIIKN
jgi:hypothetical protein